MRLVVCTLLGLVLATPAWAQAEAEEPLCADRPGLASGPCTVEPGRVHLELAYDWSFQEDGDERVDALLAADTFVRIGLDGRTELQLGWTPFGHVRSRDALVAVRDASVGDVSVGVRRKLLEGSGAALGVQATLSIPVGGSAIGARDWGAELLVPMSYEAGRAEFVATPTLAAAVDADGRGRHFAYGLVLGLGYSLTDRLLAVLDLSFIRDHDPLGRTTEALAGLALAWLINSNLQVDAGAAIGLNRDSPDLNLYVGAAQRF